MFIHPFCRDRHPKPVQSFLLAEEVRKGFRFSNQGTGSDRHGLKSRIRRLGSAAKSQHSTRSLRKGRRGCIVGSVCGEPGSFLHYRCESDGRRRHQRVRLPLAGTAQIASLACLTQCNAHRKIPRSLRGVEEERGGDLRYTFECLGTGSGDFLGELCACLRRFPGFVGPG